MSKVNFKELSDEELLVQRAEASRQLAILMFQLRTGQLRNTSLIKGAKKTIAQVNTELRARELANGSVKGSLVGRVPSTNKEETKGQKRSRFGLGVLTQPLLNGQAS